MEEKKTLPWLSLADNLCLASASPRRLALLRQVGLEPSVYPTHVDESVRNREAPHHYVTRMAETKARAGRLSGHRLVLAADTIVVLEGKILGKPVDSQAAAAMLHRLSGREHQVITVVALLDTHRDILQSTLVSTRVRFKKTTEEEILAYLATGEPMDKAGSYGIQGVGAFLVEQIHGSYTGVVGLPLYETLALLMNFP